VLELLQISRRCAGEGNANVISDVFVAITLLNSAVQASFEAIDLNLKSLRDAKKSKEILIRKNQILKEMQGLVEQGLITISQR
jgi:formiminotetrahydrofolate cyclodeaminase